jgi:hypothetical protein
MMTKLKFIFCLVQTSSKIINSGQNISNSQFESRYLLLELVIRSSRTLYNLMSIPSVFSYLREVCNLFFCFMFPKKNDNLLFLVVFLEET